MKGQEICKTNPETQQYKNRQLQFARRTMSQLPFDPKNHQQTFFRENGLRREGIQLSRLGWRVGHLTRDQEDLALQCTALLSSELIFPVNTFIHTYQETSCENYFTLWMQVSVHMTVGSISSLHPEKASPERKIQSYCEEQLLPLLHLFLSNRLTWNPLLKSQLTGKEIMECFREEVIERANAWVEKANLWGRQ